MTPPPAPFQWLQTFRQKLLGVFPLRADALFELVDALLVSLDPRSPVELSLSPAFRRRFSMVYDALRHGHGLSARQRSQVDKVQGGPAKPGPILGSKLQNYHHPTIPPPTPPVK